MTAGQSKGQTLTVAIPTYGRDAVLIATLESLLQQNPAPRDVLVLDQSPVHDPAATEQLTNWAARGQIRWRRLPCPGIAPSMNVALRDETSSDIVLFVDDDIQPAPGLLAAHLAAHAEFPDVWAVAGQVLQPGQEAAAMARSAAARGLRVDLDFPFHSTQRAWVRNVMAGNLSVRRVDALRIGGFDENFVGVAYRFETEFARRVWHRGGRILFEPSASIRHLRAPSGGTRAHGNHLCSASPYHGMGDYYFALREGHGLARTAYICRRFLREVTTRYHALHPWCIPVKLVGEVRALALALRLHAAGPRHATESRGVADDGERRK